MSPVLHSAPMTAPHQQWIDTLLTQAEELKQDGKFEEAIRVLEQILAKYPDSAEALEEIADSELSLEHYERAEVAAKRAVALDQQSYTGHYIMGFLASGREKWGTAVEELKLANHLKPNNPEILRCLGWALFASGDKMNGVVTLERALNIDPTNILILCDLGMAYMEGRNFPKAKALFERALDLDPDSVRALECLDMAKRLEKHAQGERQN